MTTEADDVAALRAALARITKECATWKRAAMMEGRPASEADLLRVERDGARSLLALFQDDVRTALTELLDLLQPRWAVHFDACPSDGNCTCGGEAERARQVQGDRTRGRTIIRRVLDSMPPTAAFPTTRSPE